MYETVTLACWEAAVDKAVSHAESLEHDVPFTVTVIAKFAVVRLPAAVSTAETVVVYGVV